MQSQRVLPLSAYIVRLQSKGLARTPAVRQAANDTGLALSTIYEYLKSNSAYVKIDKATNTITLLREVLRD